MCFSPVFRYVRSLPILLLVFCSLWFIFHIVGIYVSFLNFISGSLPILDILSFVLSDFLVNYIGIHDFSVNILESFPSLLSLSFWSILYILGISDVVPHYLYRKVFLFFSFLDIFWSIPLVNSRNPSFRPIYYSYISFPWLLRFPFFLPKHLFFVISY